MIDVLMSCSCHFNTLFEILCLFSLQNKHPEEAVHIKECIPENGNWHETMALKINKNGLNKVPNRLVDKQVLSVANCQ